MSKKKDKASASNTPVSNNNKSNKSSKSSSRNGFFFLVMLFGVLTTGIGIVSLSGLENHSNKLIGNAAKEVNNIIKSFGMEKQVSGLRNYLSPIEKILLSSEVKTPQATKDVLENDGNVCFTLAFNGNGTMPGYNLCSKDFSEVDDVIESYCVPLIRGEGGSSKIKTNQCNRGSGARLITETGVRVLKFSDILPNERVYMVPQGVHFVWPLVKIGHILEPRNVVSPVPGKKMRLIQLSNQPRVFQVENFVNQEEIDEILKKNIPRMTPSEVGFAGWQDQTRTSSTSWDFTKAGRTLQERTFDVLAMDRDVDEMADALQVLRYEVEQWYKPHTDYFSADAFDNGDPTVNNGSNRFATMFVYFSTVEEGGHTVFPHSTSHAGYNGEQLVHPGTIDTPSYIANSDARWCCNTSSTALRSPSIKGNAVLFYSQLADGSLDPYSLHGGCPPLKGTKYSGNIWIWNRPKPSKSAAKDAPPEDAATNSNGISVRFINGFNVPIDIYWDPTYGDAEDISELTLQKKGLQVGAHLPINTYASHNFVAVIDGKISKRFVAQPPKKKGEEIEVIFKP